MEKGVPQAWTLFSAEGPSNAGRHKVLPSQHVNWSSQNRELLLRWCDRSSPCDRPRIYDKFYQKSPGNFVCNSSNNSSPTCHDHEEESCRTLTPPPPRRPLGRTLSEREVKHLSMKKTIRKKMMRDLQQAFVPSEAATSMGQQQQKLLDVLRGAAGDGGANDDVAANVEQAAVFRSVREKKAKGKNKVSIWNLILRGSSAKKNRDEK